MKTNGTMVTIIQNCVRCGSNAFKWFSQPLTLGKYPEGNLMLSFAVLMSGGSISKTLLVFKHMGLNAIRPRTYFSHQIKFLFPAILHHWECYRDSLLQKVRKLKEDAVWCGDGR